MNDTVTKLMGMTRGLEEAAALCADPMTTEAEHEEYVIALCKARQALRDELTRLFTPLTDELLMSRWRETPVCKGCVAGSQWMPLNTSSVNPNTAPQQAPVQELPQAMQTVIAAMQADPDYAWSWHCNVAMAYVDAGGDRYTGNQGAARFMKLLANVDPAHELPEKPAPVQEPEGGKRFHAKFNVGDRVWHMKDNKPTEVVISAIEIFFVNTNQDRITYNAKNVTNSVSWLDNTKLQEACLFKSKAELLESL